ncbi:YihY/virulence factor BrkB family protein [Rhizosphaericola mali]|uniref:YihY/virulence factor BrkB family protein n=1 Tax=Rhizosphaericola mali TaxID=2545455 RepID=A0A5P2FZE8_9BACT|nr:YihY/virulence factor BrkB family protein [Rhizosphaericola mali]QES87768.1 YihY/virulence factor BrkB family protein [Rhizosphaericola mali]
MPKLNIKLFWKILWTTINEFIDLKVPKMAAALAYYTIFAIAPMIIIVIKVCSIFAVNKPENTIFNTIKDYVGNSAAVQIQSMITNAAISPSGGIAYIVSIIALIFSATGVFTEIQDSINIIWKLKPKPKQGWLKLIINRLLSFSILLSLGFILLVSLLLSAVLDAISEQFTKLFPQINLNITLLINYSLSFLVTVLLFGIIYKVLPDAKIKWKEVIRGAITTAILFLVGKFGIGYYLQTSKVGTIFGAAGSAMLLLVWVYYSALIVYFGATYTRVNANLKGRKISPNDYAVYVEQVEVDSAEHEDKNVES